MMFDVTLQIVDMQVLVPPEGEEDHLVVAMVVALGLPVAPGQTMPIPVGVVRVPMSRDIALKHAQDIIERAEALPETKAPSDLVVAQSLSGVDQAAKAAQQFRGPTS